MKKNNFTQTSILVMLYIAALPMTFTVMIGPQIAVAILLITQKDAIKSSFIYISTIMLTTIITTYFYYWLVGFTHFHEIKVAEIRFINIVLPHC